MPKVSTHTARQNIYRNGVKVPSTKTKSGFRRDRSQPENEKDELIVPKGQKYWTWCLTRFGRPTISLTPPTKRQLTLSDYQLRIYDFEDALEALAEHATPEDLAEARDSLVSEIEDYKSELESNLESVPDSLRDSHINNERIESLDNAISELEGIDLDFEYDEDAEESEDEQIESWLEDKLSELQGVSFE